MGAIKASGSQTLSVGITTFQVHVEHVIPERQLAQCRSNLAGLIEVPLNPRPMSRMPREGEFWVVTKDMIGMWTFAAPFDSRTPPVVTGSRAASDPVSLSLLAALVQLGLVTDGTTT